MWLPSYTILALSSSILGAYGWNHIKEDDFRRTLGGHNTLLVAFVEPTTDTSKALEPEWIAASQKEKSLYSVNCAANPSLCDEFDVTSYPTIRYFDGHGYTKRYRGPREASSIIAYLRRANRPAVSTIDEKKITAFQSIDDVVFIATLNYQDGHSHESFELLADEFQDRASFAVFPSSRPTTIVCYNNRDNEQTAISDLSTVGSLEAFASKCMTPVVQEMNRRNELKLLNGGKSLVYYFAPTAEARNKYIEEIKTVAKRYKEYLAFVSVDTNEYPDMATALGLTKNTFPALGVQNPAFGQVFPYQGSAELSAEVVERFVLDIVEGKIKPWDGKHPEPSSGHDEL